MINPINSFAHLLPKVKHQEITITGQLTKNNISSIEHNSTVSSQNQSNTVSI